MNRKNPVDLEPLAVQLTEAARLLNLCPQTLQMYTMRGEVPHKRIGPKVILYPIDELRAWLKGASGNGPCTDLQDAA
jgi:hypothetical protein